MPAARDPGTLARIRRDAQECGGAMRSLGEAVAEQLDYVPTTFRVILHVRP
ncbi:IS66 family transposase zinc-finger binding domain-containing protein [Paraburkholderia strydomiana]|uniref:IS66 family transposase zinc-finger binding domain-containing protein n=1 Tax=Paraburkholderia strydomiana TaxID=1245417 RepID=UPI0038B7627C